MIKFSLIVLKIVVSLISIASAIFFVAHIFIYTFDVTSRVIEISLLGLLGGIAIIIELTKHHILKLFYNRPSISILIYTIMLAIIIYGISFLSSYYGAISVSKLSKTYKLQSEYIDTLNNSLSDFLTKKKDIESKYLDAISDFKTSTRENPNWKTITSDRLSLKLTGKNDSLYVRQSDAIDITIEKIQSLVVIKEKEREDDIALINVWMKRVIIGNEILTLVLSLLLATISSLNINNNSSRRNPNRAKQPVSKKKIINVPLNHRKISKAGFYDAFIGLLYKKLYNRIFAMLFSIIIVLDTL